MAPRARGSFDTLWYLDQAKLRPEAEAVAGTVEEYLVSERKGLNVPDPEVEQAVARITDDADSEVIALRDGLTGNVRAGSFTWRQIVAGNCHRYERKRFKDIKLGPNRTKTVLAKEEHPINRWIRTLSDDVVLALIREHPQWLRNPAVADRICKWRIGLLDDDPAIREPARACLERLAGGGHGRRGRPNVGPQYPAHELWGAVESEEARRRSERRTWLRVRQELGSEASLLAVGEAFWMRIHGWDSETLTRWNLDRLTDDQVVMHLGQYLVIAQNVKNDRDRWVTIDDEGWPRAATIALLAARWKVEKGWVLKHKPRNGRNNLI